ncbi:kinase-like domain-containing protein [Tanacetum coccineum]
MNFVVVRSPSPYNGIIERPGVRKLQAVPSTAHGMLKLPVEGGVITLKSSRLVPLECALVSGPEEKHSYTTTQVTAIEKLIRRLSLVELEIATNQFDNRSIIGYGNMGIMYKAVFPDGVLLAVKMLHEFDSFEREYFIEINILGRLQQTNLIPLLGFCYAREKKFLVYKYMNNGSLHQWLHCCSKLHSSKEKMGNIIIASSVSSMLAIGKYQRNKTSSNSCTDVEDNAGDM